MFVPITQSQEKTCKVMQTIKVFLLPMRSEIKPVARRPRVEDPPRTLRAVMADPLDKPMSMPKITRWTRGRKTKIQVEKKTEVSSQNDLVRMASAGDQVTSLDEAAWATP